MTVPTQEQLSRLRQRPHLTRLHLSVYEPNTVLAARINMGSIGRGEREIDIDVITGDVWSVNRGQTMYIGTTPGAKDMGRLRAISSTLTQITVAENDVTWIDGWYLTVVQYYEPWAVFPRIVLNDDNVPQFFKDYDITYTDQNEQLDPVVDMGPNHAMFIDNTPTGSFASLWYTSSGTYDPSDGSIPTGFAWVFDGGFPTASFVPDPGYIQYTGAGHFLTTLTVTSNFGKQFSGRRHISVYTRPDEGPNPPIVSWGMLSYEGSRDQGGYSMRFWLRETADVQRINSGSLIVLFTDDYEGPFEGKAGGNAENRSEVIYVGYVEDDSIRINPVTNRLEFRSQSITGRMKELSGFSAALEDVEDATAWYEMTQMTVDKAAIHFLRWQSTIMAIADYAPAGDDMPVEFIDFDRTSVFDAVNNLYSSAIFANIVSDRQGKIWSEIDSNVVPTGSRTLNTAISITDQDWRSQIGIERRGDEALSYLELGGIAYSGAGTGTSDPFLAGAPGDAPNYFGSLERLSGLVLRSQVQLNELAGLALARTNARYHEVTIPLAGDYRIIDIAPQERVKLTLAAADTYRAIVWDEKSFVPQDVMYEIDQEGQTALMEVTLREETHGPPGESVEIPVDPPFDTFDLPTWELPPFVLPPISVIPPLEPPPTSGGTVYAAFNSIIARTRNFWADSPNWELVMDVSTVSGISYINGLVLDPSDPINSALVWGNNGSVNPCIFKTNNLDAATPSWGVTFGPTEANTYLGGSGVSNRSIQHVKPWINGRLWTAAGHGALNCTPGYNCPKFVRSMDGGASWFDENHFGTETENYGSPMLIQPTSFAGGDAYAGGQYRLWKTVDGGINWTKKQDVPPGAMVPCEIPRGGNSSGEIIYCIVSTSLVPPRHTIAVSVDGGVTLTNIPMLYAGFSSWAPYQTGGGQDSNRCENFIIHPYTGIGYANMVSDETAYSVFAILSTTWVPIYRFNDVITVYNLHESNDLFHYMLGPGGTTPHILGSDDRGNHWYNKEGDFEVAVASFAAAGNEVSVSPVSVI